MNVPFLDLKAQYAAIKDEIQAAIGDVMENTAFAGGPFVARFEQAFASFCGCKHAIGVGNGTDALWLSLLSLGIGPGDEVITVPDTFIATAEAISYCGAKPVFVDVEEGTFNLNPTLLEAAITPRTKAVIPVHLFGQTADMDPILAITRAHGLHVVEDACQAHGAEYKGRKAGTIGDTGCFSFYPGKNLGGMGDGGLVTTNDDGLAATVKQLRAYGESKKYHHVVKGTNARLDTIQAAILGVKLPRLDACNAMRRKNAHAYDAGLKGIPNVVAPEIPADDPSHIYHLYVIRTPKRDQLQHFLHEKGIQTGIHYPIPIHRQPAYAELASSASRLLVTDGAADQILSLPMFPELTQEQIDCVCAAIREFHTRG